MHPDRTEVYADGAVPSKRKLTGSLLTVEDATKRWWGEIGPDSYHGFMLMLEQTLNGARFGDPASPVHRQIEALWALRNDNDPDWHPLKPLVASDPADLKRMEKWFFPVYACGYNWLADNSRNAEQALQPRINRIIELNNNPNARCDQVIIITHSMGGLVARACQKLPGMQAKIAGIVHGVMPVDGAPIAYPSHRRSTEWPRFWQPKIRCSKPLNLCCASWPIYRLI